MVYLWRCGGGYSFVVTLRVNRRGNGNMEIWIGPSTNLLNLGIFSFWKCIWNTGKQPLLCGYICLWAFQKPWTVLHLPGHINMPFISKSTWLLPSPRNVSLRPQAGILCSELSWGFFHLFQKIEIYRNFSSFCFSSDQQFMTVLTMKTKIKSWLFCVREKHSSVSCAIWLHWMTDAWWHRNGKRNITPISN